MGQKGTLDQAKARTLNPFSYLNPKSLQNNGPKPILATIKATILQILGSRYSFCPSQKPHFSPNPLRLSKPMFQMSMLQPGLLGIMEKWKLLDYWDYVDGLTPTMENQMDKNMENEMDSLGPFEGVYRDKAGACYPENGD